MSHPFAHSSKNARLGMPVAHFENDLQGRMRLQRYLLIAIGGALGSIARYEIGALAAERFGMRFPVGTLVINISACLLIGFSVEFLNRHANIDPAWRYLVPVGFIGAYSTFSTFE